MILGSRLINYFAAVMCASGAAILPASELAPLWLAGLVPPWLLIVVVALPLMEMLWRSGLRPRLVWNDGGIAVVRSFTTKVYRWAEIARVEEEFNRIHLVLADGGEEVFEFDQLWLWSKISKRYAARAGRNEAALRAALARGRAVGEVVPPPVAAPRRPIPLYLLVVPAAVLGQLLVS